MEDPGAEREAAKAEILAYGMDRTYCRCDVCWEPPSWMWPVTEEHIASYPSDPTAKDPYLLCNACQQIMVSGVDVTSRLVRRLKGGQPQKTIWGPHTVVVWEDDDDVTETITDMFSAMRGDYRPFG